MKMLLKIIAVLAVLVGAAFLIFRTPDTDREAMIAKYSNDASQFLEVGNGAKAHYRDEGNKAGPTLLLIHGSNGHIQTWEGVVGELADRYRLISLDLYGHGLTGPNPDEKYDVDAQIELITKVMDAAGVQKAVWVGNSMGGWLTWRAGLAVPDRISGLVLVDASGAQVDEKIEPYLGARLARTWLGQKIMPHVTPKSLIRTSLEQNYANPELISEELVSRYSDLLHFPGNRAAAVDRANVDRQREKWADVGQIDMPVLLLWGEQDTVVPVSHGRAFEAAITGSRLIIYPDAGHLPMEETPEQVAGDIDVWMQSLGQSEKQADLETN